MMDAILVWFRRDLRDTDHAALCEALRRGRRVYCAFVFDREILEQVAKVTRVRYLAQLKLGAFRQESKSRFGLLGLRVLETKTSTIRLFLQIWDTQDGSVAWEGAQESTVSHESLAEEYVSMKSIVQESARDLVAHLP